MRFPPLLFEALYLHDKVNLCIIAGASFNLAPRLTIDPSKQH